VRHSPGGEGGCGNVERHSPGGEGVCDNIRLEFSTGFIWLGIRLIA